ncbi:glycosyltransferase family 2 protein [Candidatus Saccharibacteria bacterium TM7i]|nr:glycosyltransferase family 2 protein [Candidatus Saccharibacteria bacterium TM7i]
MTVSIIVPVYNADKYLAVTVRSILDQTHKDLEVILVNDGSTDNSESICLDFARIDDRVLTISQPNGGVSVARNKALELAKGDFVAFIDSDDIVSNEYIQVLYDNLINSGADISTCSLQHFNSDAPVIADTRPLHQNTILLSPSDAVLDLLYQKSIVAGPVCKLFKKEVLKDIRYMEGVKVAEDLDVSYRSIYKASSIVTSNFIGYYYRIHNTSAMQRPYTHDRFKGLNICKGILEDCKRRGDTASVSAAKNRVFMEAIYILLAIGQARATFKADFAAARDIIKRYRSLIIRDPLNTNTSSKIYATISYAGIVFILMLSSAKNFLKSIKSGAS